MYLQGNGAKSFSTPLGVAFDTTLRLKKEIADFDGCLNDSRTTENKTQLTRKKKTQFRTGSGVKRLLHNTIHCSSRVV